MAGGAALYLPWLDFPRHLPPGLAEYARDWLEHPNRRPWRFDEVHGEVEVPNLDFSGWYDHCNGSMRHLQLMQRRGRSERARSQTKLVAGPWNHPGLGRRGRWRSTDTWPPGETTPREYRLGGSGRLEDRGDILCYRTEPLAEAVEIAGYPEAVLFVSSSAPDTDFFARLVDEHPAPGRALEVCYGMVRVRHRNGLDAEELLSPGEVVEVRIQLGPTACRFEAGHRIRLEITSSDFPNHDRNHNTGKDDLADAELAVAANAVHHSAQRVSRLVLSVLGG